MNMQYPSVPTRSLFANGSLPSFPTGQINVPDIFELPGYIEQVISYYGDIFNAPYSHPPTIGYWTIPYPNLGGIASWIINSILWLFGWVGAVFEYAIRYVAALIVNGITAFINLGTGLITDTINFTLSIGKSAGAWAIPIEALIGGALLVIIVLVTFALGKLVALGIEELF